MGARFFVSREGLASCSGCGRHVRLDRHGGHCPFCAAAIPVAARTRRTAHGLVVVSLLGATSLAVMGCPRQTSEVYGGPPDRETRHEAPDAVSPEEPPSEEEEAGEP